MSTILNNLTAFIQAFITGGGTGESAYSGLFGQVISFVVSKPICLIPLVAWLFVLGVSSVRKMYKG